jgi:hypothetical protein
MTHNILSIDVGLLNLAFCGMEIKIEEEYPVKINIWQVINTLGTEKSECSGFLKSGEKCIKLASYTSNNLEYCKLHIPNKNNYKKIKVKKCNNFTLQEMAINIIDCINKLYESHKDTFEKLDKILIELQPRVNNKMKFVSHIIFGKFTELVNNDKCLIRFVAAKNKLKNFQGPRFESDIKSKYGQRKKASIYYCKWYLENYFIEEEKSNWLKFLEGNKKADDLCDTFNMCIQEYKLKMKKK